MKLPVAWSLPGDQPLEEWAEERKEKIDGRPVVVSVSGGKDSTACCLLLQAAGIPYTAVHMDTGWESEITEAYLKDELLKIVGPIEILRSEKYPGGMEDLVRSKGMLPTRVRRFCTQQLKVFPFKAYLEQLEDEPVNVVGIRRAESKRRSEMPEWDMSAGFDCEVWRPIIHWTYDDVIEVHKAFGAQPNPLYTKFGATRVGCWPCIFARKNEIRMIADKDPARIDLVDQLEADAYAAYKKRVDEAGTPATTGAAYTREDYGWFQNPNRRAGPNGYNQHLSASLPIRKVVEWARTARGGKQWELFAPDYATEGCMRWGMCEQDNPDDPALKDA